MSTEEAIVVAKYDYTARDPEELDIKKNERLVLLDDSKQWWRVQNNRNQSGFVPSNYVKRVKQSILGSLMNSLGKKSGKAAVPAATSRRVHGQNGDADACKCECNGPCHCPSKSSATVRYAYQARQADELTLTRGEQLHILEKCDDGWWRGRKVNNPIEVGWFPSNYIADEDDTASDSTTYSNPAEASTNNIGQLGSSIERAITLYSFQGEGSDTLSFAKDEVLDILEKNSESPDWWKAKKADGQVGLVPKTYVQLIDPSSPNGKFAPGSLHLASVNKAITGSFRSQFALTGSYANEEWFFGDITRCECDDVLAKFASEGQYIVRVSETNVSKK